jgi:hypothetical protein
MPSRRDKSGANIFGLDVENDVSNGGRFVNDPKAALGDGDSSK